MSQFRRTFLSTSLSGVATATLIATTQHTAKSDPPNLEKLSTEITNAFAQLPGQKGLKLLIPALRKQPDWSFSINPDTVLVCASAFKVFVLAEALRQVEASLNPEEQKPLVDQLEEKLALLELVLDESVYTIGSDVFNPPDLSGKVLLKTVLQAMMLSSDNTATDMALKFVNPDRVRQFLHQIGLQNTRIPDSTRQFGAYVLGYPQWQTITWAQLLELLQNNPYEPRPPLNNDITFASTASDFVSFYSRTLQGQFFNYAETLDRFKAILSISDSFPLKDSWRSQPLGMNVFMKHGWGQGILCRAGGLWLPAAKRWLYFSMTLNWDSPEPLEQVQPRFLNTANQVFVWIRDVLDCQ
ncbi:MAG: serine hydrolase [Chroococcidiopsidaceae cyanobacterium CP_BM_ER_R8_30]|nr:serine hydrolase [Chroococcidiopsidaceae cyanobacterium CP_BM_ER_R8_30]